MKLAAVLGVVLAPAALMAAPIASSSFTGAEDPLFENGSWAPLTSLSPGGGRFQKNNGAFPDRISPDHAGARTTALVPADHYSEIVVGHLGTNSSNVGPIARVQTSGASIDSHYLWWASEGNGINNLYRIDANGTSYSASPLLPTSSVIEGDRLRLIGRGPVIYGIKNGVRDFIYNTGPDTVKYAAGTSGILAFTSNESLTDATIASWSTGPAPASSGTRDSSIFVGVENPLDEGDRWYPLPGYSGFRKAGGLASGRDFGHNASGVWSIAPPPTQYSEVTLGTVGSGGGGPIVRIDRNAAGQTGWLLFLWADDPTGSGIFKMNPDGSFTQVRSFAPLIVSGDKWRLAANGNTLEVFRNGVSQFTHTIDGSYPAGDVGIEALSPAFTFLAWEGGELDVPAQQPDTRAPGAPGSATALATSGSQISLMWTAASDDVGVTGYLVERCQGAGCTVFAQIATTPGTSFSDAGLSPRTAYSYRVRAADAAGNLGPYSNVASATTLLF
ncbi:MAG: fibronectin type III domain-containing protein [Myxococcales bacterium]